MKTAHDIVLKPVITENSMAGIADKKYTFKVATDATKVEIAQAVETLFPGTKVAKEEYIYPENTYDLVVSNLVLHYIENLANVYQKVYCTLKVGGYFLFNIEHPTFTAGVNEDWIYDENGKPKYWPIDNYYYTGERETNFLGQRVIKQHHTLTQILNPLIKCGFQIEAIEEAMPPADMMGMPGMCNEMRRPMMLLVKVKKV